MSSARVHPAPSASRDEGKFGTETKTGPSANVPGLSHHPSSDGDEVHEVRQVHDGDKDLFASENAGASPSKGVHGDGMSPLDLDRVHEPTG